jgi:hypothetical protein
MADSIIEADADDEVRDVKSNKSDLMKITTDVATSINYKLAFFMFIVGMLLFSDIFIDSVLSKFSDAVVDECPTTKGTIIQLLIFSVVLIVLDLLIRSDWL